MEPERQWKKGFVKNISFKSGIEGRGSDRVKSKMGTEIDVMCAGWGEPASRRRVNRMRLTERKMS